MSRNGNDTQAEDRDPPARWGSDMQASRAMAGKLRLMVRGDPEPSPEQWRELGQALWRGDPLADDVVEWMHANGLARTWPLFESALNDPQALNRGDLPPPMRRFVACTQVMPSWAEPKRMAEGARVLRSTGRHGMMVLRDAGLMAGYQASAINQTLVMTGALQKGAQRRVAETTAWWLACLAEGGLAAGGEGFTMTLRVRLMHAMVRHRLKDAPGWHAAKLGLPVNQLDMQATYLAFSVVQLIALKTTGLWVTRKESEAVMHLWRYIGWLMGVEESLLCDDEASGRLMLYHNVLGQSPPDETSVVLGQALMDEPLTRHYPRAAAFWGRFNRARHLSLVRWFTGVQGMQALGLPPTSPWYPIMMMVPWAVRSLFVHAVPGLEPVWTRWAGQRQQSYLRIMLGNHAPPHLTGSAPDLGRRAS